MADRAAWAQEAAERSARMLVTVTRPEQLGAALGQVSAVLHVPDVLALGDGGQLQLVRLLASVDHAPKLVLGMSRSDTSARGAGLLREDLHYRLRLGRLNLDAPGLREAIARRRSTSPPRPPAPARAPAPSRPPRPEPGRPVVLRPHVRTVLPVRAGPARPASPASRSPGRAEAPSPTPASPRASAKPRSAGAKSRPAVTTRAPAKRTAPRAKPAGRAARRPTRRR